MSADDYPARPPGRRLAAARVSARPSVSPGAARRLRGRCAATFEHGAWADRAFPAAAERARLDGRERAQAQRLAYGAVQRRGHARRRDRRARRPVAADDSTRRVLAALRLGLYELLFSDATPDHAAVDQAVELAKGGMAGVAAARGRGWSTPCCAARARERDALLAARSRTTRPRRRGDRPLAPAWLAEMWWAELGADDARALLAADNEPAETALRVNTLRPSRTRMARGRLADAGEWRAEPPGRRRRRRRSAWSGRAARASGAGAHRRRGARRRRAAASAAVVAVLDPRPGERVLDLCAGPGIKTTQIAARMHDEGEVVAVELRPGARRRDRASLRAARRRSVRPWSRPMRRAPTSARGYDRVLVDPPCSDLGTLASRPDARWRKSPRRDRRLAELQAEILARAASALRPGGTLVYSTCTISRRENEDQVAAAARAASASAGLGVEDLGRARPRARLAATTRASSRPAPTATARRVLHRAPEAGG